MSGVRRVFAGVHGSLGSLQALRFAANEARYRDAPLCRSSPGFRRAVISLNGGSPISYLRKLWRDAAQERLWDAFDHGLGGLPADLSIEALVVRGPAGPVLVDCAKDPDDLLVIGTGARGLRRVFRRSASRYCLAHARCPVIAVPPSALMEETATACGPGTCACACPHPGPSDPPGCA